MKKILDNYYIKMYIAMPVAFTLVFFLQPLLVIVTSIVTMIGSLIDFYTELWYEFRMSYHWIKTLKPDTLKKQGIQEMKTEKVEELDE